MPANCDANLSAAVHDMQDALQKMTGEHFETSAEALPQAICLKLSGAEGVPAEAAAQLKGKGCESFVISSPDENRLWIVSNGQAGLAHGIYYYLEQLGVRYYFPNDNWTIIPQRRDIALRVDQLVEPAFKLRTFFGTGGFGPASVIDPKLEIKDRWGTWQRRNRFGGEYVLNGHAGEAFNVAHKEVLLQHPEYLAKVNGQYVPWSETAKLNPANPAAVQLFVEDRLAKYREQRRQDPGGPLSFAVSVDPADGADFCNSEECKKIGSGSPSDQVFYIANQVAKAVAKEFPDGHVNLYAYAERSAVPTIPLEPNVYVQIIPYSFQDTGLGPEEFIKAWGSKIKKMSLYDYWSIPDWNYDQPGFDYRSAPGEKIRLWNANHIDGFTGESTYSAGAMGLAWYLSSRIMWDPKVDEKALVEEFYQKAFGPAAQPMQRMMERWSGGYHSTEHELGLSFRDMQEAMRLAQGNPEVARRVDDYARYLQFLRLQYENSLPAANEEEKEKTSMELLRYIWSIDDTAMIHTFRLSQFLLDYGRNLKAYQAFDPFNKEAEGWKGMHSPTHEELEKIVKEAVAKFHPLQIKTQQYSRYLAPVGKAPQDAPQFSPKAVFKGSLTLQVLALPGMKSIDIKLGMGPKGKIKLNDEMGATIWELSPKLGDASFTQPQLISLPIAHPGFYTLELINRDASLVIQTPAHVPMVFSNFLIDQGSRLASLYFYVPQGTEQVVLNVPSLNLVPDILDSEGKPLTPVAQQDGGKTLVIAVPPGQDGKVWSLGGVANPDAYFQMLSTPQWFSLRPDTMMAPEDVAE